MAALLQDIEARIMNLFLGKLRQGRHVFSHALVHDALFVDKDITVGLAQEKFAEATKALGLGSLTISLKTWDGHRRDFERFMQNMTPQYNPYEKIRALPYGKHMPEKGQTTMLQFLDKVPKDRYQE